MPEPKPKLDRIDPLSLLSLTKRRRKPRRDKRYPSFNRRMLAGTIDLLLLAVFAPIIEKIAPINRSALLNIRVDPNDPNKGAGVLKQTLTNAEFMTSWCINLGVTGIVFCLLSVVCWRYWSATPGKMLLRLKIVDEKTEQPITTRQIAIRVLAYWVSVFSLMSGFFWIGYDKKGRAWHDILAGTMVIALPWKKQSKVENAV